MGIVKPGDVRDTLLFGLIHDFFKVYLPTQRNSSKHTIVSYKTAVDNLLDYVTAKKNIPLAAVTFEMIDSKMLASFLAEIEENGNSVATRNHRLACIRAFYAYAAKMESAAVIHYDEIFKVPLKKSSEPKCLEYMSEAAVLAVLAEPDTTTEKGLRDQFIMLLLYETAARIQELMDVTLRDIYLGKSPTVTIMHGKGEKTRVVPITEKASDHCKNYVSVFHADEPPYSATPLFYTFRRGQKNKMHHDTPRRFMCVYGLAAREKCCEVPENVHPHLWRHSRAMHLYQRGMDLTILSQWLGHASIDTTLTYYAYADTEHKRRAIEAAIPDDSPLKNFTNAKRYTVTDDEKLKRLCGLR